MNAAVKRIMDQLAIELKRPKKNQKLIDQLNAKLDQALGTELSDEDPDRAEAWERSHR